MIRNQEILFRNAGLSFFSYFLSSFFSFWSGFIFCLIITKSYKIQEVGISGVRNAGSSEPGILPYAPQGPSTRVSFPLIEQMENGEWREVKLLPRVFHAQGFARQLTSTSGREWAVASYLNPNRLFELFSKSLLFP